MKKAIINTKGISNLRGFILLTILSVALIAPYGCHKSPFDGLQEGKVVYDVTIEGEGMNPMMKAMMPSEVTTYFNNNKTCTVISMGMNMMETRLISDAVNFKYTTLISAMGKKIAMVLDKKQVAENYTDRVDLKVVQTGEEKEIAGVKCHQAMITDSTDHTYPVYYTQDLALSNPNWSSPFRDIDGLLMEYSISFGGMIMKLKAKEIVNTQVDASLYEIPEGYEIIKDPKDMKFGF
jgi:hypothetical protein